MLISRLDHLPCNLFKIKCNEKAENNTILLLIFNILKGAIYRYGRSNAEGDGLWNKQKWATS